LAAERLADPPAGNAVFDPESTLPLVAAGKRKAIGGQRVREERGVEVQTQAARASPIEPVREVFRQKLIALDLASAGLSVDGMQVQPVPAGDEAVGQVEVAPQLVGRASLARVIAGGLNAAARQSGGTLEAADVIPLPTVQRDGKVAQFRQGPCGIDA
jgi:hypothetical protein